MTVDDRRPIRRGLTIFLIAVLIIAPTAAVYWLLSGQIDDSRGESKARSIDGRHVNCAIAWSVGERNLPECAGFYPKR